jgi:exonuclease SbcD
VLACEHEEEQSSLMESFRFLHSADIHLDSPLRGLSRYDGVPTEAVRTATRQALNNLVDAAIENNVAFVIIAGDLYDGEWDDFGTGLFFCGAMGRLEKARIPVYLLFGNHDAESQLTKRLPLPENVHRFSARRPESFKDEQTGAVLHGQSYRDRDPGCSLAAGYPMAEAGRLNIGVLHTALTGGDAQHAPYSPCTPSELASKGYDYWALGHVHGFQVISDDPWIVFPGNLQGRNIRETGPKGAALVTVEGGRVVAAEHLPLDVVRWASWEVDLSGLSDQIGIEGCIRSTLQARHAVESSGLPMVSRITLSGQTSEHLQLKGKRHLIREDVRAIAAALSDQLWIEKVVLATGTPDRQRESIEAPDDLNSLLGEAGNAPELEEVLAADFLDLCSKLPPGLSEHSDLLELVEQRNLSAILIEAAETLRVRLEERSA